MCSGSWSGWSGAPQSSTPSRSSTRPYSTPRPNSRGGEEGKEGEQGGEEGHQAAEVVQEGTKSDPLLTHPDGRIGDASVKLELNQVSAEEEEQL